MIEQSQPSSTVSLAATKESSSHLAAVNNRLQARQLKQLGNAHKIGVNTLETATLSPSSKSNEPLAPVRLYEKSECPKRHTGVAIDETRAEKWTKVKDDLVRRMASGYLVALVGDRGPGKTQIGQQAIMASCAIQRPALYVRALDIFLRLRSTYKSETETELQVIDMFRDPMLLVIDEVQERGESDWENRMLTHIIDKRYGDMTDTLLIANLKPRALQESLGPSVSDRLRESGGVIECKWGSFRKAKT